MSMAYWRPLTTTSQTKSPIVFRLSPPTACRSRGRCFIGYRDLGMASNTALLRRQHPAPVSIKACVGTPLIFTGKTHESIGFTRRMSDIRRGHTEVLSSSEGRNSSPSWVLATASTTPVAERPIASFGNICFVVAIDSTTAGPENPIAGTFGGLGATDPSTPGAESPVAWGCTI